MSLRKFISGVTAFAVAATAFAAMAVTASAETEYKDIPVTPGILVNVTDSNSETYTLTKPYGGAIADLTNLKDIKYATTVTVEFDTYVVSYVSSNQTKLCKIMYGVGDKKDRGLNGKGSGSGGYNTAGLITYFGSNDGSNYIMKDVNGSYTALQMKNKAVHAVITLDRKNDTYTATLSVDGVQMISKPGTTAVDNITVIEAFTWNAPSIYDVTFKNIKVTYTVPPCADLETATWTSNDGAYTVDAVENNKLTDSKGNAVYGYKTEITGEAEHSYTVKGYIESAESEGKTTLSFGTITDASPMEFYLITDEALDLTKSRVYCE